MDEIIVLTPGQSKKLLAKGLVSLPVFKQKMKKGMIAICKGSTNSYLVEEILNKPIDKLTYLTGKTLPAGKKFPTKEAMPDLVLKNGKPVKNLTAIDSVKEMKKGDLFIKGANVLNYERKEVGILIGHPTGGTIGATIGIITAQKINLLVPVGLEKSVGEEISKISQKLIFSSTQLALFPLPSAQIFTEIEALKTLGKIEVQLVSKGGILGAEGAVRLLLQGKKDEMQKVLRIIAEEIYAS
jgi:hypothetical protein